MYIQEIRITNIRSIHKINWTIPESKAAGWHVVVGDNGAGKSSFLRAVALALVGPDTAQQLRQPWDQWLTKGAKTGTIRVIAQRDSNRDRFSGRGRPPESEPLETVIQISRQ